MITIIGDMTKEKLKRYMDEGNTVEGFKGGFTCTNLDAPVDIRLPHSVNVEWVQAVKGEVETSIETVLTIKEYFNNIEDNYVFANVRTKTKGIYNYPNGEQLKIMMEMFDGDNIVEELDFKVKVADIKFAKASIDKEIIEKEVIEKVEKIVK